MKFNEFKSKDKGIRKKEKELKKQKMKNNIDKLTRRKRDIQLKMNKFVNGPSSLEKLKFPAFTHKKFNDFAGFSG